MSPETHTRLSILQMAFTSDLCGVVGQCLRNGLTGNGCGQPLDTGHDTTRFPRFLASSSLSRIVREKSPRSLSVRKQSRHTIVGQTSAGHSPDSRHISGLNSSVSGFCFSGRWMLLTSELSNPACTCYNRAFRRTMHQSSVTISPWSVPSPRLRWALLSLVLAATGHQNPMARRRQGHTAHTRQPGSGCIDHAKDGKNWEIICLTTSSNAHATPFLRMQATGHRIKGSSRGTAEKNRVPVEQARSRLVLTETGQAKDRPCSFSAGRSFTASSSAALSYETGHQTEDVETWRRG